ncbi:MAG: endolytic transglycosylase MltG [Deltaproteobacteria bacterium]|nr:endolytic transglycosylase MltG [Deltaproteobacteria bacterium]
MRKKKILIGLTALLLLLAGVGLWDMYRFASTPANEALGEEARYYYLLVEKGASFDRVAEDLFAQGGLGSVDRFKLLGRLKGEVANIKAGEFEFSTAWTPAEVLEQLVSGRTLLHRITIPEGLPWWEVGELLERGGFATAEDFAACVKDADLLRRYGIPFATAEGFLFPETYLLNKGRTPTKAYAQSAMETMVRTFWSKTAPIWAEAAFAAQLTPVEEPVASYGQVVASFVPAFARENPNEVKRLVILASLVEKESAVADERPRIAGVYSNRLRINMPLQCDPTIIYGLGDRYKGKILRSHLTDASNPYNTYKFYGLPPGPICSPGLGAIQAAAEPEVNKYLYFVATGKADGRHIFSRTLSEHNAAVLRYRAVVRAGRR